MTDNPDVVDHLALGFLDGDELAATIFDGLGIRQVSDVAFCSVAVQLDSSCSADSDAEAASAV